MFGTLFTRAAAAALALAATLPAGPSEAVAAAGFFATPAAPQGDAATIVEELESRRDEADPALFHQLAGLRSKAGADALVRGYDAMASVYMRREALRALAKLDGVPEAQQTALQKLSDVATGAKERELRESALELIGGCPNLGKTFLIAIVESPAQDDIRERAMELFVAQATDADIAWFRKVYLQEGDDEDDGGRKRKKRGEEEEQELVQHRLASVRRMAFEALAPSMPDDEVLKAATDGEGAGVRRLALLELERRQERKLESIAEDVFTSAVEPTPNRVVAAEVLARLLGPKAAKDFLDEGEKAATPTELRFRLADLLSELDDEGVNKKVLRKLGKGRGMEKLFYLRAARAIDDPKVSKALQKMLADKDTEVRIAAARALGERRDASAIPALEKLLEKNEDEELTHAVVDALSDLLAGDAAWDARLMEYAAGDDLYLRNAALKRLGATGQHDELLREALSHPQWSTRLVALHVLAERRTVESVGWMVARMQEEEGRILHEFADVLFELTGQPFRTAKGSWKGWWEREGANVELIDAAELERRRIEEEDRRLKMVTSTQFFGIRIVSQRVTFVIDISGSMVELTRARYRDEKGEQRITVAQRELKRCIESLAPGALFNVIAFNSGVDLWLEDGVAGSTPENREQAKEWVQRLGAGGGTNIYDSLREAFRDPEIDTIYLLSDGEPTAGTHTDPAVIREHVRRWNEDRGIVIHCIAIGGSLQVLEWLAADTGGTYIRYN